MAAKNKAGISVFQKYLTVWVILCMVVGVLTAIDPVAAPTGSGE